MKLVELHQKQKERIERSLENATDSKRRMVLQKILDAMESAPEIIGPDFDPEEIIPHRQYI